MPLPHSLASRFSDWVLAHPVLWAMGSGVVLVALGVAVDLAPVVVVAGGATVTVGNVLHAKKRGYCPLPAEPSSRHPSPRPSTSAMLG